MLDKKRKIELTPEETEANSQISVLSLEVSRLEGERDALIVEIGNHKGNLEKYKEQSLLLQGIMDQIEAKKVLIQKLSDEIDELFPKKNVLLEEVKKLDLEVGDKKEYIKDIAKLKENIGILQKEEETFQNQHALNKKAALKELDDIKDKIKLLHADLGNIISKV